MRIALDALDAMLDHARIVIAEYDAPAYYGNGFASGVVAAARESVRVIEAALRPPRVPPLKANLKANLKAKPIPESAGT